MKNLTTLIIVFLFAFQLKAQTKSSNDANKYAILQLNTSAFGNYGFYLYLDNNKYIDIYKTLRLDTLKLTDDDNYSSTYTIKGLNFMDREGYDLVSSSMTSYAHGGTTREFIFRKKNVGK